MNKLFFLAIFSVFICCKSENTLDKRYVSLETATGGFSEINISLNKNGKINIIKKHAILEETNEASSSYSWETTINITGKYILENDSIKCCFSENLDSLNKMLDEKKTNIKTILKEKSLEIKFSESIDTLIIENIPCVKEN